MKTSEPHPIYAGVDISKDRLDVSLAHQNPSQYPNNASGIAELRQALGQVPGPVQVICEPSGGYERALLEALWAAQLSVSLVNAARVRSSAASRRAISELLNRGGTSVTS